MAYSQAKIGWKTQRKRENKNCHFIPFCSYPTRNKKFQNRAKKFKIPLWHHFKPKQIGKYRERENIKFTVPFRSYPKRN